MAPSRDNVVSALQLLSSKDSQYDLLLRAEADPERRMPLRLAEELWIIWNRAYSPQRTSLATEFSDETNEALGRFADFFDNRRHLLPEGFEKLMADVHWLSVIEYANVLLAQLAQNEHVPNRGR